jgi:two-component system sensor histidine kinase BaeS
MQNHAEFWAADLKHWRIPIALRLFLTVLLTTLLISTISLGVLHWAMQKNFSRYVTQVEMRKLGHLNNNLAEIYQVYGNWQVAIDKSVRDDTGQNYTEQNHPERKQRLMQRWLLRQFEIAQQQNDMIQNPALFQARMLHEHEPPEHVIPSHFEPFKIPAHLRDEKKIRERVSPQLDERRRWFGLVPDQLGFGQRLALYDADKHFIVGDNNQEMPLQEIRVEDHVVGYLGLRPALDADDALSINFFSHQQRYLLLIFVVSIMISAIVALIQAASFRQPIHRLLNAAVELSKGNYRHHVEVKSNDELGDLSQVINQLAVILEQHEQSRRQWVADTSHELKTPLAVLQAQIEAMQDGVRKATPEHLARMMSQVVSLKKLTQDLADLAQADAQQFTCYLSCMQPWNIVRHEVENFKSQFEQKQLQVSVTGQGVELLSDPDRFRQIIVNLLSNSVRYTEVGGHIQIHTDVTADEWQLHIDDSPLGVTDEQLQQLGQRFYRVDDSRTRSTGGTGLGLALSKKIAQALGGDLQFSHSPLGGLRCTVRLKLNWQK